MILFQFEWIRDNEHITVNCSSCQQDILYEDKPAYFTPDRCDHQFCLECMVNATRRNPMLATFKCPVCDEECKYIRLYR